MEAAVRAIRKMDAARIIVAAPTIAPESYQMLAGAADDAVAVLVPADFHGVGEWYEDFSQTSDEEVRAIVERENHRVRQFAADTRG